MQHHNLPHHFTASGLVLADGHILLVNHKRLGAWVPPGGHIEEFELPEETAVREILEETGVRVEVVCQSAIAVNQDDPDAFFLAQPLFIQSVLAIEQGRRFYHLDFVYLCRPLAGAGEHAIGLPPLQANAEVKEARWIHLADIDSLPLAKNVKGALQFLPQNEA
jgi:ADP-ribose pyrophosphatase YjhB (NUDIX family)